jgi:hypothetical protein
MSSRKLLIFGNGLGMAIDPVHFSLQRAMEYVWGLDYILTPYQKELISRCVSDIAPKCPHGEDELDILHHVCSYCSYLNEIHTPEGKHWLSQYGQEFPLVAAKFIHKVATELHNYTGDLPAKFSGPLIDFIIESKSHVATLNYDKLIYNCFIDNEVVAGYSGTLVDGMLNVGFFEENLGRKYDNDFGYYLHLHGSPLFVERGENIIKLSRSELDLSTQEYGKHIVLSHIKHKPDIINSSRLLSTYWNYLNLCLDEAHEIIVFGYSGLDLHLNNTLKFVSPSTPLKIVEWSGSGKKQERELYWNKLLGRNVKLVHLDNVCDFNEW